MGGSASKQDIVAKLNELDQKELDLNLKLKDMQIELNGMVPKSEQIKVNQNLTADSKINHDYQAAPAPEPKSVGAKKKKNGKSTKSKGKGKSKGSEKKGKVDKDKKKKK